MKVPHVSMAAATRNRCDREGITEIAGHTAASGIMIPLRATE